MVLTTAARNASCNALVDLLDAGAGAGYIEIWTTGKGTKLATLTFSDPAFGDAVAGVATASAITADSSADATGTAAEYYVYDSDDTEIWHGDVGTGSEDIVLNTTSIVAGANVSISSWTVTQPA